MISRRLGFGYRDGTIYEAAGPSSLVLLAGTAFMSAVLAIGLLVRDRRGIGFEGVAIPDWPGHRCAVETVGAGYAANRVAGNQFPPDPRAASRSSSSAAMHDAMIGSRAPSIT